MTDAERRLWHLLRAHRFGGAGFRRQVPMGPFIADFASHRARLVIKLDGGQHGGTRDQARDAWFAARGYRVLRFWNTDVLANMEGVLQAIGDALAAPRAETPGRRASRASPAFAPALPPSQPSPARGQGSPAAGDEGAADSAPRAAPPPPLRGRDGEGDVAWHEEEGAAHDAASTPSWAEAQAPSLLPLFAWLSPAFPVGAYAYSHTLEWAVEAGDVGDEASLAAFLADLLIHGFGRGDGILLAHAHRAAAAGEGAALAEVNALAVALAPSAELRLETCQQGRSFLDAVRAAWPAPRLDALADHLPGEVAYPAAVGLCAACHHMPRGATLDAFLLATAQALVSAAVRLAPIGQTAGTRVVAHLAPALRHLAAEADTLTLDDLGSATFRADLGSFRHETQYTRLFRS